MRLHKALLLFLFGVVLCIIIFCSLPKNPFDPTNPDYKKPAMSLDSLDVHNGDTVSIDSLTFVVHGKLKENIFRWRIKNPNDPDTAWSTWTNNGAGIDTIKLTQLQPGAHVLNIQTAYNWNGDITDTILTFYKVNTPSIVALSDTLVKSAFAQSCTLWVKAAGTKPLSFQWFKDAAAINGKTKDTLIFPSLIVSDTGRYRCLVSNSWGHDSSKSITLSVAPRFMVSYDKNNANEGEIPMDSNYYKDGAKVTILGNSGTLKRVGCTFTGWNTAANGIGTDYAAGAIFIISSSNVTLFAKWTINQYKVIFDTRGGTAIAMQTIQHGGFASSPPAPTKANYTFTGWFKDSSGTQAWIFTRDTVLIDLTLYSLWTTKPTFTVIYDANGSTGGALPSNAVNYETNARVTVLGNLGMLEKTGYTFAGWNTAKDESGATYIGGTIVTVDTNNITLFAKWKANQYTVSFDTRGGSAISKQTISYGEKASSPTAPAKQGLTFTGWFKDSLGTQAWVFTRDTVFNDMTLYANWTTKPTYIVKYDGNGNSAGTVPMEATNYETDAKVTVLGNTGNLIKTGYSFTGWNIAANGNGIDRAVGSTFTMGTENVTLFAQWTINHYTLTYSGNGNTAGTTPPVLTKDYNTVITVSANTGALVKTGYTFAGWNTVADGSGIDYAAGSTLTIRAVNDTLYAKWTINQYTVAFDAQGGSSVAAQTANYGSTATGPTSPIKTGYTFAGWFKEQSAVNAWSFLTDTVFSNVTIFAKWTINHYIVAYKGNGGTAGTAPSSTTHDYGTTVTVSANTGNLVRTGYIFGSWNTMANGSGTDYSPGSTFAMEAVNDTLFLYAKWNSYAYTITFDGQGATTPASPISKTVASPATTVDALPTPPSKTGFAFSGWYAEPNGSGMEFTKNSVVTASDTVYAKWNSYSYTVTFNDQSATTLVTPTTKTIASPATTVDALPTPPNKTGCTFSGWYTAKFGGGTEFKASTVVTASDTVYANWTVTDIDGNIYHTMTIGTQSWLVDNLKTTKLNDNTEIPLVTDITAWSNLTTPGYCWYNNDISNKATFGTLYNWYTVNTGKLAPAGWHVATDDEWATLVNYLGGTSVAGGKLKEAGTIHWSSPNTGATNESGFSAFPGGYRYDAGTFNLLGINGYWWSSMENAAISSYYYIMRSSDAAVEHTYITKTFGFSVRCVMGHAVIFDGQGAIIVANPTNKIVIPPVTTIDALPAAPTKTGYVFDGWFTAPNGGGTSFTAGTIVNASITVYAKWVVKDIDGNVYTTVAIGTQTWMGENLKTKKFNDGSSIPLITDPTIWANCTTSKSPGYCWYDNNEAAYQSTYGPLYNWYTVGTGKLAPAGWHVATDAEWTTLTTYLGGESAAGGKMKEGGTAHWQSPNAGATNVTGFSALPGGCRSTDGLFYYQRDIGYLWSASELDTSIVWNRILSYSNNNLNRGNNYKSCGFSVRLVRDY
jgi:uncharacterized protein (TIGR02145 family)/uncharacterized repeat protein (TIGR02543 family)